jgi:perosamine synthetase
VNVEEVLKSNFPNEGRVTFDLQEELADYLSVKHAFLTTSGTVAIFLALKALGIGKDSRVGVPNLTFIATANAVTLAGAEVVLLEVDSERFTLDLDSVKNEHKKRSLDAIIPVHISGKSAISEQMLKYAQSENISIIEDAAEAFGSQHPKLNRKLGTIGDAGAFSFSPNKIITSGQGGLVVTNDDSVAFEIKKLKDQGRPVRGTGGADIHESLGFNFKYTDIQAAILKAQIPLLEERLAHLRSVYEYYRNNIVGSLSENLSSFEVDQGEIPLWPEFQTNDKKLLISKFEIGNIGYRELWFPLSSQNPYKSSEQFPRSSEISRSTLWLASAFCLTNVDLKRITDSINEALS